jgi:hypothetical protein
MRRTGWLNRFRRSSLAVGDTGHPNRAQAKNSKANPINSVKSACGIWENLSGGVEKNSDEIEKNTVRSRRNGHFR